jgi:hypothetical protein
MRSILLPFLVLFAFVFAACEGTTTGGSTGTDANGNITSVELHAEGSCTANEDDRGRFRWSVRPDGSTGSFTPVSAWSGVVCDPNNNSEVNTTTPLSFNWPRNGETGFPGWEDDTTYEYRIEYKFESNQNIAWTNSFGENNPSDGYDVVQIPADPAPPTSDLLGIDWSQVSSTVASSVTSEANQTGLTADIGDQDSRHDTYTLANALIARKTSSSTALTKACDGLADVIGTQSSSDRALSIGRGLQAYVYAASLVDCGSAENTFRTWVGTMQDYTTTSGPSSLRNCADVRPNNWGTHCRASMLLSAVYLGQTSEVADQANLFRSWVGDSGGTYSSFVFDSDASNWGTTTPIKGINPVGATKSGYNVDGVLPDDQRRPEGCTTNTPASPCDQDYVYEALQGVVIEALALEAAGYDAFGWASQAVKRAYVWERDVNSFLPSGDDRTFAYLAAEVYGLTGLNLSGDQQGKGFVGGQWLAPGVTATG